MLRERIYRQCQQCDAPTIKEWLRRRRALVPSNFRGQARQHIIANLGPALDSSFFTIFIPEHSLIKHSVSFCPSMQLLQHITQATFGTPHLRFQIDLGTPDRLRCDHMLTSYS
jgi:hypothetical protein